MTQARVCRFASFAVLFFVALAASGCSSGDTSETDASLGPTSTMDIEPGTTSAIGFQAEVEADYLAVLRAWADDQNGLTVMDAATDEELVTMGRVVCDELDDGVTVEALMSATFEQFDRIEATLDDLQTIFVTAVGSFCPGNSDKLD